MKILIAILMIFSCKLMQARSAVTYTTSGGRFGDNLLAYCHAKWISHTYNIPLLYKPFGYSDQLMMHQLEERFSLEKCQTFDEIIDISRVSSYVIEPDKNILYIIPYFPESIIERKHNQASFFYYFSVNWREANFRQELNKMICPIDPPNTVNIPNDCFSVAVHMRIGTGFDISSLHEYEEQSKSGINQLKFPPYSFYINQLKRVSALHPEKKVFVHIFTDHTEPVDLVRILEKEVNVPNMQFAYRTSMNSNNANVLEDFFSLLSFDCIIRSDSNFSVVASKLKRFDLIISPWSSIRDDNKVVIDVVSLEQANNNSITVSHVAALDFQNS